MISVNDAYKVSLKTLDDAMTELWHHQQSFEMGYYAGRLAAIEEQQWTRDMYYGKKPMGLRPDPYLQGKPRTPEFYKMRRLGKILRRRFSHE